MLFWPKKLPITPSFPGIVEGPLIGFGFFLAGADFKTGRWVPCFPDCGARWLESAPQFSVDESMVIGMGEVH